MEWLIWQNGVVRCVVSLVAGSITSNRIAQISPSFGINVAGVVIIMLSCATAMWAINVYANVVSVGDQSID